MKTRPTISMQGIKHSFHYRAERFANFKTPVLISIAYFVVDVMSFFIFLSMIFILHLLIKRCLGGRSHRNNAYFLSDSRLVLFPIDILALRVKKPE